MVDLVVVEVVVMQDVAELTGVKGGAATDIATVAMAVCWRRGDQTLDCGLYRQTVYPAVKQYAGGRGEPLSWWAGRSDHGFGPIQIDCISC